MGQVRRTRDARRLLPAIKVLIFGRKVASDSREAAASFRGFRLPLSLSLAYLPACLPRLDLGGREEDSCDFTIRIYQVNCCLESVLVSERVKSGDTGSSGCCFSSTSLPSSPLFDRFCQHAFPLLSSSAEEKKKAAQPAPQRFYRAKIRKERERSALASGDGRVAREQQRRSKSALEQPPSDDSPGSASLRLESRCSRCFTV